MRALTSAPVVAVAAAAVLFPAPSVFAAPSGDDGTVTILDAATGEELRGDESAVCTFRLGASSFDGRQQVPWKIAQVSRSGAGGTVAETGVLTLDSEGRGTSGELSLRDGRYRLVWDFEDRDEHAAHAVFRVDCDGVAEEGDPGEAGPAASPGSSSAASAPPEPEPQGSSQPEVSASYGADAGVPSRAPSPAGDGDLAETGAGVSAGALAAAGASLLGAGTYLLLRRREERSRRG